MSRVATATLQTPWDCKWSEFGRVRAASRNAPAEGLWVCSYPDGRRRPIEASECETCPHWEYASPVTGRAAAVGNTTAVTAVCPRHGGTEQRLEGAVRVVALALAAVFAATGFVVLTRPLAIPLTISLWMGALICFLLGLWGPFNRGSLPTQSW